MQKEYCSSCGSEVLPTDNYCTKCGAYVDGSNDNAEAASPAPVTNKPKQALRKNIDYISLRNLPLDAIVFFFFNYFAKSFLIFGLVLVGAILQPMPFVFGLVLYFVVLLIITLFIYNNFMYAINEDGLRIQSGVINRRSVALPYEQIQNVNIERTLFDRILGFSRISIETAGASSAQINGSGVLKSKSEAYIPGLHVDQAKKVHDLLIDGADGNMED